MTEELIERLWLATKHGDEDHQQWLRDAYTAFFADKPVPEPRGKGNKEKLIQSLSQRVDEAAEAVRLFPEAFDVLTAQEMRDAKGNWRSLIDQQTKALTNLRSSLTKEGVVAPSGNAA